MRGRSRRSLGWGSLFEFPSPVAVTGLTLSVSWNGANYVASSSWVLPVDSNPVLDGVYVEWSINGGAFVADATYPTTQTTATKIISGGQTVAVRVRTRNVASVYSSYVTSSTTGSAPEAVTGFTATNSGTPGTVSLSWTNPTSTTGVTLTPSTGAAIPALGVVTSYSHVAGQSVDVSYTITANNAYGSSQSRSSSVRTLLASPTSVSITATNPGNIVMQITDPERPYVSYYTAALETSGVWSGDINIGLTRGYTFTGAAHGTSYRVRSRAVDTFGQASAYATSGSAAGINDTAGPTVPAPTAVESGDRNAWTITMGAMSDISTIVNWGLEVYWYDRGYWEPTYLEAFPMGGTNVLPTSGTRRGKTFTLRRYGTDQYGNTTYSQGPAYTTRPQGTLTIFPSWGATWSGARGVWRTDTQEIQSGYSSAFNGDNFGFWFYNNDVINSCMGYAPDSGTIFLNRTSSQGVTGTIYLAPSACPGTNVGASYDDSKIHAGPSLTAGSNTNAALPASHLASMGANQVLSMATVSFNTGNNTNSWRVLAPMQTANTYSGVLTLVFN